MAALQHAAAQGLILCDRIDVEMSCNCMHCMQEFRDDRALTCDGGEEVVLEGEVELGEIRIGSAHEVLQPLRLCTPRTWSHEGISGLSYLKHAGSKVCKRCMRALQLTINIMHKSEVTYS